MEREVTVTGGGHYSYGRPVSGRKRAAAERLGSDTSGSMASISKRFTILYLTVYICYGNILARSNFLSIKFSD